MAPTLYFDIVSPPVRCVMLVAEALKIDLIYHQIDLFKGEHHSPEFLKLNPLHQVPVLKDHGIAISDSHAIICYLADEYGNNATMFPKDPLDRAVVLQRLFFESGVLFKIDSDIMNDIFVVRVKEIAAEKVKKVKEVYGYLETFLSESDWLAGAYLSLADLSCVSTLSTMDMLFPVTPEFPLLANWLGRCKELPYYEKANQQGLNKLKGALLRFGMNVPFVSKTTNPNNL